MRGGHTHANANVQRGASRPDPKYAARPVELAPLPLPHVRNVAGNVTTHRAIYVRLQHSTSPTAPIWTSSCTGYAIRSTRSLSLSQSPPQLG
eukprot:3455190-Heterocapsa_arctica.AAC.1